MATDSPPAGNAFLTLAVALFAAVVVVRGTLSLLPDWLRYDRYGDTRDLIVMAMYLLGIAAAAIAGRWAKQSFGSGGADQKNHDAREDD